MVGDPGRESQPTTGTLPHRQLHDLLGELGFDVEDELSVPPYSLDCYVRELHLGFEADGALYHSGQRTRQRDAGRDRDILVQYGIEVLRLGESLLASGQDVLPIIEEFIEEHAESAETRRLVAGGQL